MKKKAVYFLNGLGWFFLLLALVMGCVREIALDPGKYYELQKQAGVHETAGVSEADLLQLDVSLANYLAGKYDDPNLEIEVNGEMQPAFNEKEIQHLADCRRLFAPVVSLWLNIGLAVAGVALALYGEKKLAGTRARAGAVWIASAVILLPLAILGVWAAIDFDSAFTLFHKLLFANDLWLLDPGTDLLIRICPASMFESLGLRIGVYSAVILLGLPALTTVLNKLDERKRKRNESAEI